MDDSPEICFRCHSFEQYHKFRKPDDLSALLGDLTMASSRDAWNAAIQNFAQAIDHAMLTTQAERAKLMRVAEMMYSK